jgi:hypothetical protein
MKGVHDPLWALALFIDNGEKQIVLCSVDHLGFTYEMVQKIIENVHSYLGLEKCEVYIGSSHTHSGGGAFLNIPVLGEALAGPYNAVTTQFYIDKTTEAIFDAHRHQCSAKVGIGYGNVEGLSKYRGAWPPNVSPLTDVSLLKITDIDDKPLAVFFNYPVHPTILDSTNRFFSADFVGYARNYITSFLGPKVEALYFNGAQGDILPVIFNHQDRFDSCDHLGYCLAESVKAIWDSTIAKEILEIDTSIESYFFTPKATPFGLALPISSYMTEMNLIVFNKTHAFITIPGELSSIYDHRLKEKAHALGFAHLSIFGLTNDAHGYIILPESWRKKTFESSFSFGGENYGESVERKAERLLDSYCNGRTTLLKSIQN